MLIFIDISKTYISEKDISKTTLSCALLSAGNYETLKIEKWMRTDCGL